jgi:hypothetical protein
MIVTSKYDELAKYLKKQDQDMLRMTFDEVSAIVGDLPQGAYDHRAWWANSASQNHAINGWLNAGWETSQVDMDKEELVFIRAHQVVQDSLLPGYLPPKTRRRSSPSPQTRMDSELELILRQVGGLANLAYLVDAVERYMRGDIQEMELGQQLRKLWARKT